MRKLGSVFWEVLLKDQSFKKGLDESRKSIGSLDGQMRHAAKGSATVLAGIGAIAGAVLKMSLKPGLDRALNIEDAQAKLRGLGHDTKSIENIMTSALESVEGTFYGLDQAATIAASAVAAGVKPGKDLTRYLKLTGDAATIAGADLSEMGSIINKVQTQGRAYTMEINQLADRGIPIWQWLAEEYGVTQEALRKMVAAGEVDSATYLKVIEENIGGAALSAGDTTRGAIANTKAAFARVGETILKPVLKSFREAIDFIRIKVSDLNNAMKEAGGVFNWMKQIWEQNSAKILALAGAIGMALTPIIYLAVGAFVSLVASIFPFIAIGATLGLLIDRLVKAFGGYEAVTRKVIEVVSSIISKLVDLYQKYDKIIKAVAIAVLGLVALNKTIVLTVAAKNSLTHAVGRAVGSLQIFYQRMVKITKMPLTAFRAMRRAVVNLHREYMVASGRLKTYTFMKKGYYLQTKLARTATMSFGKALAVILSPVGLIVAGIALLVGGLILLYKKNEAFRNLVQDVWGKVLEALKKVWEAFQEGWKAIKPFVEGALKELWEAIQKELIPALSELWGALQEVWDTLVDGAMQIWTILKPALDQLAQAWRDYILPAIIQVSKWVIQFYKNYWPALAKVLVFVAKIIAVILAVAIVVLIKVITWVVKILAWFIKGLTWLVQKILPTAITIFKALVLAFKVIWNILKAVGAVFMWLWNTVVLPYLQMVWWFISTLIIPIFQLLWAVITLAWTVIWGVIQIAWAIIEPIFQLIWWYISEILIPGFQLIWSVVKTAWDGVVAIIRWAWNNIIRPIWNAIYGFIVNYLIPYFQFLWATVSTVFNFIWGAIKKAWEFIEPIWQAIWSFITGTLIPVFQRIWNTVRDVFTKAWNKIKEVIGWIKGKFEEAKKFIDGLTKKVGEIKDKIMSAFNNAKNWLKDKAKDIVQGLIDGIKGQLGRVGDIAGDIKDKLVNGVKSGFGIFSPSRVMKTLGMQTGEGFNLGLRDTISDALGIMDNLNTGIVSSADIAFANAGDATAGLDSSKSKEKTLRVDKIEIEVKTKYPPSKKERNEIALNIAQDLNDILESVGEEPIGKGKIEGETNG